MNPRWMCDRISTWLKDAAVENGPVPLGARALATRMRDLGTGCTRPDIRWCGERRTHAKGSPWIGTKLKQMRSDRVQIFAIYSMMFRISAHPQAAPPWSTASRLRALQPHVEPQPG